MKEVLISIKPKWVEKIASKVKSIEVRKSAPKEVPFKCYIYETKANGGQGKVIGEFICDKVYRIEPIFSFYDNYSGYDDSSDSSCFDGYSIDYETLKKTCLTQEELCLYGKRKTLYGWHISDLKIYNKPKELSEFYKCGAESLEKLLEYDGLCQYCRQTDYGEHKYCISPCFGMVSCEGSWCDEAYEEYLDVNFAITRAPQSWQFVQEKKE